jgi:hypothetical protein
MNPSAGDQTSGPFLLRRTAALLLGIILLGVSAGAQRALPPRDTVLHITFPGESHPAIGLGFKGGFNHTLIPRAQLTVIDADTAGDFTGVDLLAQLVGNAINIRLSIVYPEKSKAERLSSELIDNRTQSQSFMLHEGESVRLVELVQSGIEPFELAVRVATPRELKPGEGPRIINNTTALEVARIDGHLDSYVIAIRNASGKNVVAYAMFTGKTGYGANRSQQGAPVIAAEAIREIDLDRGLADRDGITISSVVFDDGTFEGDPAFAARFLARAEGLRIEAPQVLLRIDQTLSVNDNELVAAFDKTESELWLIPEAIDKQSAIEFLKIKFPSLNEKTWSALYEELKGGLYDARNIALTDMGVSRRGVREQPLQNQDNAVAVKHLRASLERVKQALERIASGKL